MKLSVYFTPLGLTSPEVSGRPVLVIDVLRATTTIVTALGNGAKAVLPAESGDDALTLANNLNRDDVLLIGERRYQMIEGFAFGNSPVQMTAEAVRGMTLIMATSNGTPALLTAEPGRPVLVGAAVNFSAAVAQARAAFEERGELIILCAGHDRRFTLEDAYTAGRYTRDILTDRDAELNDGAIAARELVRLYGDEWEEAFGASSSARRLRELGLQADVTAAAQADRFTIVPRYTERQVRVHPAE